MQHILTYIKTILICAVMALLQGCSDDGIIPRKDMVSIVRDIYLADQYIQRTPHMLAQTDSLRVYPAVMEKYGYTVEDYENSLRYYLQEGKSYSNILLQAQRDLEYVVEELDIIIQKEHEERLRKAEADVLEEDMPKIEAWWAVDSVRTLPATELVYDPLLRSVRWLVMQREKLDEWSIRDSAIVDIPQNPIWWINNLETGKRNYEDFYLIGEDTEEGDTKEQ